MIAPRHEVHSDRAARRHPDRARRLQGRRAASSSRPTTSASTPRAASPARSSRTTTRTRAAATLRGLHAQLKHPQGKLVRAVEGEMFDVAVDIRRGSPTPREVGRLRALRRELPPALDPPGFAHGFCVTSERVHVEYKCTGFYDKSDEVAIAWNDPAIGIEWPIAQPDPVGQGPGRPPPGRDARATARPRGVTRLRPHSSREKPPLRPSNLDGTQREEEVSCDRATRVVWSYVLALGLSRASPPAERADGRPPQRAAPSCRRRPASASPRSSDGFVDSRRFSCRCAWGIFIADLVSAAWRPTVDWTFPSQRRSTGFSTPASLVPSPAHRQASARSWLSRRAVTAKPRASARHERRRSARTRSGSPTPGSG